MDDKRKILNEYLAYRRLTNNENKIRDIERNVRKFLYFKKIDLKDYTEIILIDFLKSIEKYAVSTKNDIKAEIKHFLIWKFPDYSTRYRNLTQLCKTQQTESPYRPEDMISEADFERLIKEEKSVFWKAYFSMLFYGCCRPSELFLLKWKDLDMSDRDGGIFFSIFSKKNKRTFLKYLPMNASYFVKQLQSNNSEFVFINPIDNKLLKRQQPYYEIKKISQKALGRVIDLYTLRHSIATINYRKDIKDDIIARQMGHSKSMKNTYSHNDKTELMNNAKKIYLGEMPPENKVELEKKVDVLTKALIDVVKVISKNPQVPKADTKKITSAIEVLQI